MAVNSDVALMHTTRLVLRRPHFSSDHAAVFAIHGDPRTNVFNPKGAKSEAECLELLRAWDHHWSTFG